MLPTGHVQDQADCGSQLRQCVGDQLGTDGGLGQRVVARHSHGSGNFNDPCKGRARTNGGQGQASGKAHLPSHTYESPTSLTESRLSSRGVCLCV